MTTEKRKGFTLIEILIVVAIIAILASVVLVGLGPTQQAGRDARRISDLSEVQTGLELYYNKFGIYPGTAAGGTGAPAAATWASLSASVTGAGVGITAAFPNDPSSGKSYQYWYGAGNTHYVIGATLENANNSVFTGYTAPSLTGFTAVVTASGTAPSACASPSYCTGL
jgi:prepilin-type N-terminal cleavage/methylation domain-containing protein